MKKIFCTLFVFSLCSVAFAQQKGSYSTGYRMGFLSKLSEKGVYNKSWEGEMLMGNESSLVPGINPWKFSVEKDNSQAIKELQGAEGQYVIIKYEQDMGLRVTRDTSYRVVGVRAVNNSATPNPCASASPPQGNYSHGSRIGRLVKISERGMKFKSWEVIMQVGNSGGQFFEMSVSDEALAKCMISYLGTGRKAKIQYDQALTHDPLRQDTDYQILSVEPIQSGLSQ